MKGSTGHTELKKELFRVTESNFAELALKIFHFQYNENIVYRQYCNAVHITAGSVRSLEQIPFLPIQFFKTKEISSTLFDPAVIFESSATTGSSTSRHLVKDAGLYEESFLNCFGSFYGNIKDYCVLGLLPSYLERKNSSLVWMVNELIKRSGHSRSGFYLYDHAKLRETILENERSGQACLLIGVTYALLDFFEEYPLSLEHTIIMETGGMKGRRNEMTREAVHRILIEQSGVAAVNAEYGMTELLSQAYSKKDGIFYCPPWMKIFLRDEDDPLTIRLHANGKNLITGIVNVADLANLYSCSFIATDDIGKLYNDGSFEILGRVDNSDVRGCSLMVV